MFSLISSSSVRCFHSASIYSRAAFSSPQHSSGKSTVRKTKDNVPVIYFLAFVEAACSLLVWRADGQAGLPRGLNQAVPGIIGLSHEKKIDMKRCFALQSTVTALQAAAAAFQKEASVWTPPAYNNVQVSVDIMSSWPKLMLRPFASVICFGHLLSCCRANVKHTFPASNEYIMDALIIFNQRVVFFFDVFPCFPVFWARCGLTLFGVGLGFV